MNPCSPGGGAAMLGLSLLLCGCVDARHVLTVLGTTAYVLPPTIERARLSHSLDDDESMFAGGGGGDARAVPPALWMRRCASRSDGARHDGVRHRPRVVVRRAEDESFRSMADLDDDDDDASSSSLQRRCQHAIPPRPDKNPLGHSLISLMTYRTWLRAGAVLGVLLPLLALVRLTLRTDSIVTTMGGTGGAMATKYWTAFNVGSSDARVARGILGGPLFLLCSQAFAESVARTALLPLPIRILIPLSYNAVRLPLLQYWAFFSGGGAPGAVRRSYCRPCERWGS